MVETRSCDYCGSDIEPGTGTMLVYVDGRVVHFCSSKCENNAELGRASRDLEWTGEGQRIGASRAGPAEEVEQVAAEPPAEADTMADELDIAEDESEAEAVAAATGDTGSRSDEAVGTDDESDEDTTAEVDEEVSPLGESARDEETDPDEAEANVGDEMVRESDADETDDEADEDDE